MTPGQLATLNNDILVTNIASLGVFVDALDDQSIADWYNQSATPDFWVWRTRVSKSEYTQGASVDATTFAWTGTGFITRSVGERDAWRELFDEGGTCNPSLANVRQAFQDIFSGATAPAPANRTHLATTSRRLALRLERLFAVGAGTTASPALMGLEGLLSYLDVARALRNVGV